MINAKFNTFVHAKKFMNIILNCLIHCNCLVSSIQIAMAEEPGAILKKTNANRNDIDNLIVVSTINLQNIEKKGIT